MIGALPWEVGLVKSRISNPKSQTLNPKPQSERRVFPVSPAWEWVVFALILCLAAGLRLWRLDSVPPGLTHDEAGHGQDALAILHGARPLYETIGYGREPLYDYVTALGFAVLGRTDYLVLRGVSATFGLLAIVATYLWARRAFGPWEAILTCGWLAGSFWAVSTSRQALRSSMLPALLAGAIYAWWRGAFDPDERPPAGSRPPRGQGRETHDYRPGIWFALSGLFVAATMWNYMAARVTWALFLFLPLFLLVTDRARFVRHWRGMLLTLLVAGAVAAPMFIWLHQHPGAEQRFSQLDRPLRMLASGDMQQLWDNALEALRMFTVRADDLWVYNVPGRPWLGAAEGALFYAGVALALWRWRRPQYALALAWLFLGILPSVITGVSASATRAVAALPPMYIFPAIALSSIGRWVASRVEARGGAEAAPVPAPQSSTPPRPYKGAIPGTAGILPASCLPPYKGAILMARWTSVIVTILLLGCAAARTYHDYFDVWGNAVDVRVNYHTTLVEVGRDLDRADIAPDTVVLISSIYPGRYHDPYALPLITSRDDLSLRWVDGRGALVFPNPATDEDDAADRVRLIVKALAPIDPALERALAPPHARLLESHVLRPDDLNPRFDVYEWDSAAALEALLPQAATNPVAWSSSASLPADDPEAAYRPLTLPADMGHVIALLGYDLSSQVVAPGELVTLVTYWRVLSLPGSERAGSELETVLFTHLLNPGGDPPITAQQDRLDAPCWNWHPGEVIAQVHRLYVAEDVPHGLYPLEVGAYTRATPSPVNPIPPATRLALYVDGEAVSDHILLPPLQVGSSASGLRASLPRTRPLPDE